ncbi:histidine kinase [Streptomyces sp. NPDC005480]|uniref:sensor histidine kinase n=1 Tax=Streptomyces sp. NPDC005480 TaxID=3154880 RepID=UPI0033B5F833
MFPRTAAPDSAPVARRGISYSPAWVRVAIGLVAFLLLGLIAAEAVVLTNQPTAQRAIALGTGVAVCICAIPLPRVRLEVRGTVAAVLSLSATVGLLLFDHSLRDWGLGECVALLLLLAPVLRRSAPKTAARLGPALAVAAITAPVRDAHPGPFTLVAATLTALVTTNSLSLRAADRRRVVESEAVRADERRDLARELHDLVAHHVAGIVVLSQAGRVTARDDRPAVEAFKAIEAEGGEALAAMRRLVGLLRAQAPDEPVAGMEQVRELVDAFARTGPPATLRLAPGLSERLDETLAATVHRIVREALTNIRKHGRGVTAVMVDIRPEGAAAVRVVVRDDGQPKSATSSAGGAGRGFGVLGMTERAELLGGHLVAGPQLEGGWQVEAVLPAEPVRETGGM